MLLFFGTLEGVTTFYEIIGGTTHICKEFV